MNKGDIKMNVNKEYNKKLFVVREYSNSETATANTDILEYLYQCGDSMKSAAETSLRIARTMLKGKDISFYDEYNRVATTPNGQYIKLTKENRYAINSIIDKILDDDTEQYVLVWDIEQNPKSRRCPQLATNPRLIDFTIETKSAHRVSFDSRKLFHLVEDSIKCVVIQDGKDRVEINEDVYDVSELNLFYIHSMELDRDLGLPLTENQIKGNLTNMKEYVLNPSCIPTKTEKLNNLNKDLIKCKDCGGFFFMSESGKKWFADKGWNIPKLCKICSYRKRSKKKYPNDK